jgi:hypothetical protein
MTELFWIGGLQGSGKTTLARRLGVEHGLPVHRIDSYAYLHADRLASPRTLDEELALGPEASADAWERSSAARLPLVLADIQARGLPDVPVIVEGPQLSPELARGLPVRAGVWLLVRPEVTARVRAERAARAGDPGAAARSAGLAAREAEVRRRLERRLRSTGSPTVVVPDPPDWDGVYRRVRAALGVRPGIVVLRGPTLTAARRQENRALLDQVTRYRLSVGQQGPSARIAFACECGTSACTGVWWGTDEGYRSTASHVGHPVV